MKRKAKTNPKNKAIPTEFKTLTTSEDDCFGKEWESTDKNCVRCSEYETCMVIFHSQNFERAEEIKAPNSAFLDELDFQAVPWEDIYEQILLNPGEISYEGLLQAVEKYSKCQDKKTIIYKCKNWIISKQIKIKDSCLYCS